MSEKRSKNRIILGFDDLLDALSEIHGFPIVPHTGKEGILFELLLSRAYFSKLAVSNENNAEAHKALEGLLGKIDGIIKYQPSLPHSVDHDDVRRFQEEFRGGDNGRDPVRRPIKGRSQQRKTSDKRAAGKAGEGYFKRLDRAF